MLSAVRSYRQPLLSISSDMNRMPLPNSFRYSRQNYLNPTTILDCNIISINNYLSLIHASNILKILRAFFSKQTLRDQSSHEPADAAPFSIPLKQFTTQTDRLFEYRQLTGYFNFSLVHNIDQHYLGFEHVLQDWGLSPLCGVYGQSFRELPSYWN